LTEQTANKRKTSNPIAIAINKLVDAEDGKTKLIHSRIKMMENEDAPRGEHKKNEGMGHVVQQYMTN
jgi:hypothetical protein